MKSKPASPTQSQSSSKSKPRLTVSVRHLVEFILRTGDLAGGRDYASPSRALEGTLGHQRLQRSRPAAYQTEQLLSYQIEEADLVLIVQGRVDGLMQTQTGAWIEEIKTVLGHWDGQADPLHWAQAKVYAHLHLQRNPGERVEVQLSYLNLETTEVTPYREHFTRDELAAFFEPLINEYLDWTRRHLAWLETRNQSIHELDFPFLAYRQGQRRFAVQVYRTLMRSGRLFAEAPTGIGKTVSALFPAVKAMGNGHLDKLFYLTARTMGRTVAEKALDDLRQAGLHVRAVTLTAKEKLCQRDGQPCDPATCPLALGYYDRIKNALRDALTRQALTRPVLEEIANRRQVCPFAMALEIARWSDVIICDYNYVFAPGTYLRDFFSDADVDYAFLIDEAHNLAERARDMFSADLDQAELNELHRALQSHLPATAKELKLAARQLSSAVKSENPSSDSTPCVRHEIPSGLVDRLRRVLKEIEPWLWRRASEPIRDLVLPFYFRILGFMRIAEIYDDRYVTLLEPARGRTRVRLFCLDPSELIRKALQRGKSAVFFSATLRPMTYFHELLGGQPDDTRLQLASPFPPENLGLFFQDRVATHYKARAESCDAVAEAIAALVRSKRGNYLVYFPSYKYLETVRDRFRALDPHVAIQSQTPGMSEPEREQFLAAFQQSSEQTLVGFALMGGIFGEGIDLVGEQLVGAVIVGVGLPQIGLERDLIRDYFDQKEGAGFEFAYMFPGMNRVLQAVGRVIRSESDRGVVLLIDSRFGQARYRNLFPPWWRPCPTRNPDQITEATRRFWECAGAPVTEANADPVTVPPSP